MYAIEGGQSSCASCVLDSAIGGTFFFISEHSTCPIRNVTVYVFHYRVIAFIRDDIYAGDVRGLAQP